MTPDELRGLVELSAAEVAAALAPLTEGERKKLSKAGVDLLAELRKKYQFMTQSHAGHIIRGELIALAVGPWGTAKNLPIAYLMPEPTEAAFRILDARRPDWLPKWVEHHLDGQQLGGSWGVIRRLVKSGACERPTNPRYITAMLMSRAAAGAYGVDTVRKALEADPELLEHEVFQIFEIAGANETILEPYEHDMMPNWSWGLTLKQLAAEGVLDRGRLLDASLDALARGPMPKNATWYNEFHKRLEPTLEEAAERQKQYCDLLASPVPTIVGVALEGLAAVAKGKRLDGRAFAQSVAPVFELKPKNHPTAALKLLEQVAKRDAVLAREVAWAAAGGIGHAAADVQTQAMALQESLPLEADDADLAERISSRLDLASATLRERIGALVARLAGGSPPEGSTPAAQLESPAEDLAALQAEAESLDKRWRELAGIDALLSACEKGDNLSPVKFDAADVPQLDPARALAPIAGFNELVDRLLAAMERLESADEFELLLDGLSRLSHPRPADFAIRTAALAKRVIDEDRSHVEERSVWAFDPQSWLAAVIRTWLHGAPSVGQGSRSILPRRIHEVCERILAQQSQPMLACPTHASGWIAPRVLVERAAQLAAGGREPPPFDLIAALWRLAPDGRASAQESAKALPGEWGTAIRSALQETSPADATHYACSIKNEPKPAYAYDQWPFSLDVKLSPSFTAAHQTAERPISAVLTLLVDKTPFDFLPHGMSRMIASLWPANCDAALWLAAKSIAAAFDRGASSTSPAQVQLEPLLSSDRTWSEAAQASVALALMARPPEVHSMAADVLIGAIEDGRTTGEDLGQAILVIARGERAMLNRLAEVLSLVARGSLLHVQVCRRIAETVLAGLESPPRDLHYLLSALVEWLAALGEPIAAEAMPILKQIKTGKTAKLAKQLLAPAKGPSQRPAVFALALRGRIDRARRWQSRAW